MHRRFVRACAAVGAAVTLITAMGLFNQLPRSYATTTSRYGTLQTRIPSAIDYASGVAVDKSGNLFVTDDHRGQVLELSAGASAPHVLPFVHLRAPGGIAVDQSGDVFVADHKRRSVFELPSGSVHQKILPFTGLSYTQGLAVDTAGDVFVADGVRVLELASGATTQTVLPFTGLRGPMGVAADQAGDVYVVDSNGGPASRILELPAGSSTPSAVALHQPRVAHRHRRG